MDRQVLNDVLFLLVAAHTRGYPAINRTAIQRLLYLCAALFPLKHETWGYNFSNARFGPFNQSVNQAGDKLVLRGFCEFDNFGVSAEGNIRATYRASNEGIEESDRIRKINSQNTRFEWISLILKTLDIYGLPVVSKLASSEPSYASMRAKNQVGTINLDAPSNDSVALTSRLTEELQKRFHIETADVPSKLILYFDFLSSGILKSA